MSITKTTGCTDTAISGVSSLTLPRGLVNFTEDFRVKSDAPGKEMVITNITASLDSPETFRVGYTELSNIYSGSKIDPAVMNPSKQGISVLVELKNVISVTDSTNPEFCIQLPMSYHLVIKVPKSSYITSNDILTGIGRLASGLFDTGVSTNARLDAILRGSLVPTDL